ncbi:hypothetical protein AXG93_2490s1620 [Marchantia polymorpha subsp. ruderalis]|uniref:Uncharacterized protein n=1 Tax=Marchantia polymorpha subsp. ruderalis TaxID=1480154 RepID=A0A176W6Y3_MARPO|nr:hypothetical protein AXG93_2490s1620 [Marchantia polymorpha subsp. ruderalis]
MSTSSTASSRKRLGATRPCPRGRTGAGSWIRGPPPERSQKLPDKDYSVTGSVGESVVEKPGSTVYANGPATLASRANQLHGATRKSRGSALPAVDAKLPVEPVMMAVDKKRSACSRAMTGLRSGDGALVESPANFQSLRGGGGGGGA